MLLTTEASDRIVDIECSSSCTARTLSIGAAAAHGEGPPAAGRQQFSCAQTSDSIRRCIGTERTGHRGRLGSRRRCCCGSGSV